VAGTRLAGEIAKSGSGFVGWREEDTKIFDLGRPKMTAGRFYKKGWISGRYAPASKILRAARRNYLSAISRNWQLSNCQARVRNLCRCTSGFSN
jgi:hypothetical protein